MAYLLTGKVIREAKVASESEALVVFLRGLGVAIVRVGIEAGPLSQWLSDGLQAAGFEAVLLETLHVKAALSAMAVKTDRRDARDRATATDGLLSSRASQVGAVARNPGTSRRT